MSARIEVVLFGPEGRGSFNEAGYAGAARARRAGHEVTVTWVADPAPQARAQALLALCERSPDLIVAHGGQGDYPVSVAAERFARRRFVVTQGSVRAPNVATYEALQEQSAFLAGVLAAHVSQTGVVAHMSGEKVPPGLKGRAAFLDGVRSADTGVRALTTFCGSQHDARSAFDTIAAQQRAGADVVFAMIDGGRDGAIAACRELGMLQIGNVLDWTERLPDVFIASAIADSGRCVERAITDFGHDAVPFGGAVSFGLAEHEVVRLALARDAGNFARMQVEHWGRKLIDGTVRPARQYDGEEFAV